MRRASHCVLTQISRFSKQQRPREFNYYFFPKQLGTQLSSCGCNSAVLQAISSKKALEQEVIEGCSQREFSLKRITTLSRRNQLTSTARRAFCKHGCQSWGRWRVLRADSQEQQGSACSLHAAQLLQPPSAVLCHEGQQDMQAAPGGHLSAM